MRLADVILRQGHLSEIALAEAWNTGIRPAHLDRCEICTERALEMSQWLHAVQTLGEDDADAAFPPERLAAQRNQVMSRLEQLDRRPKVITFPARAARLAEAGDGRRVNPRWLAAAAAAGLALGVVSVELSHMVWSEPQPAKTVASQPTSQPQAPVLDAAAMYDDIYSQTRLSQLDAMDEMTPRLIDVVAINR